MKVLSSNSLKIIACVTMLIDHIGIFFFPEIITLRIIGRLSFPIFAFLLVEGYTHTKSKPKYILSLTLTAAISQIPYSLYFGFQINILFSFVVCILLLMGYDFFCKQNKNLWNIFIFILIFLMTNLIMFIGNFSYGIILPILILSLYLFKSKGPLKWSIFTLILLLFGIYYAITVGDWGIKGMMQIFAVLSVPIIILYNGQRGSYSFKWLFYIFYPAHLTILYLIFVFM